MSGDDKGGRPLLSEPSHARLDAFVDAAFAFAVTLLLIRVGTVPDSYAELAGAMREVPAFAFCFAAIAMFWSGHVRWRRLGGPHGAIDTLLGLALVFLVLIYVYPLRLMGQAVVHYATGSGLASWTEILGLFGLYGLGFAGMSLILALLMIRARRGLPPGPARAHAGGEAIIWLICAASGLASVLLGRLPATELASLWVYAGMSPLIGLFAARWDWSGAD